ncbi:MAG: hypothetical protein V4490_02795 [Pseudomonadota bacterium]
MNVSIKKSRTWQTKTIYRHLFLTTSLLCILIGGIQPLNAENLVEKRPSVTGDSGTTASRAAALPNAKSVSIWKKTYQRFYFGAVGNVMSFNYNRRYSKGGLWLGMVPTAQYDVQPNNTFPRTIYTSEYFLGYVWNPTLFLEGSRFTSQTQAQVQSDGSKNIVRIDGYGFDVIKMLPFPSTFNLSKKFNALFGLGIEMNTIYLYSNSAFGNAICNQEEGDINFRWTAGFNYAITKHILVRNLVRSNQRPKMIPKLYPDDEYWMYSIGLQYDF